MQRRTSLHESQRPVKPPLVCFAADIHSRATQVAELMEQMAAAQSPRLHGPPLIFMCSTVTISADVFFSLCAIPIGRQIGSIQGIVRKWSVECDMLLHIIAW